MYRIVSYYNILLLFLYISTDCRFFVREKTEKREKQVNSSNRKTGAMATWESFELSVFHFVYFLDSAQQQQRSEMDD